MCGVMHTEVRKRRPSFGYIAILSGFGLFSNMMFVSVVSLHYK